MNTNRWFHIDFHNLPGIDNFCNKFDADKLADMLSSINVTRVNLFAMCNLGYSYYNTKIGVPYPGLKCDMFGESLKACHKKGIDVVAYINVGINQDLALKRPELCRLSKDKKIIDGDIMEAFARLLCYNNDEYIEYTKNIIKEILEYDIDGMFLDCCYVRPCYCKKCTAEMLERGIDISDEAAVYQFSQEKAVEYCRQMRELLPEGKTLYVNCMPYDKMEGIDSHIEVESLPGGWGYDYFPALAAYARNLYDDVVYMTGRFQKMWADFGGFRSTASLEYDAFDSLMYGTGFSVGDHMHPNGTLDEKLYATDLKKIYSFLKSYEPWTDKAKYVKEIAILRNKSTTKQNLITPALRGVTRMLSELKYNFDIINEEMDLSPYKLIILADEFNIDNNTKSKLEKFISDGGSVLSSGTAGLCKKEKKFVLDEYSYLSYEGDETGYQDGWAAYYRINGEDRDYSTYAPGILMKNSGGTSIADHIPAQFPWESDGLRGYVYIPPTDKDGYSSIASKGKTTHISFPIFRAYYMFSYPEHRKLVGELIGKLISNKMIIADELPVFARASITGNDEYKLLHIKTTYPENKGLAPVVDEHITLPAGKVVAVEGEYNEVSLLPECKKLNSMTENGYTKITLPEINGYAMFLLK